MVAMSGTPRQHLAYVVPLLLGASLACSSGSSSPATTLPHFNDLTSAPAAIEAAARAVVRVRTSGQYGSGSFISATGLLLTNNHILGAPVCPVEGCWVSLSFQYQIGHGYTDPVVLFAVPVAIDVGLDMATAQIYVGPGGARLATPDHLTLRPLAPAALLGMHVTVVGHPEGHLKKWTDGTVFDADGDWFQSSAYDLPGNSGSPVLDDDGQLVGLLHRSPKGEDLITGDGVNVSSIGTASGPIASALGASLPPVMISTASATTADDVVANDAVYQNARATTVGVGGSTVDVLALLAQACDAALQAHDFTSPDDLQAALAPCRRATYWIECRADVAAEPYAQQCPADASGWSSRFAAANQATLAMNGQLELWDVSWGPAILQASQSAGRAQGAQALAQALSEVGPPLDFTLASYLATFGISSYAGSDVTAYVIGYAAAPEYQYQAADIASAAGWLGSSGALSRSQVLAIWAALASDPQVSVGSKLYIEDLRYRAGAL